MDTYEHTHSFDRRGCIVGAKYVTYTTLKQWYVCRNCGGTVVRKIRRIDDVTTDWAECGTCDCRDFISQRRYDRQCVEYTEIVESLPPDLRELFPTREPLQMDAQQATDELFD